MTQPAPADRLTAGQLAALLTLVQAQAAVRQQLTQTAVAAAMAAFQGITNWWLADEVSAAIAAALRIIQPTQRQAAQITSSYIAQAGRVISGQSQRAAGTVDVTKLRRDMPPEVADDFLDGVRVPGWVLLGNSVDGPADSIDDDFLEGIRVPAWVMAGDDPAGPAFDGDEGLAAAAEPSWIDPEDAYGRVADAYRFNVTMRGDSPEVAAAKAIARIAAVAETDVTLAVRAQYQASMSSAGAIGFRRILHPELSETGPCALCVVAADRIYKTEDLLPIHGNCVPAGTRVAAEGVRTLTRRRYTGALVNLRTASGEELTITANHPVLTDRGWVPAHLVGEGDHVVRHRAGHGVVGRSPHEGDVPPKVEEVWRAAVMAGALVRPGMPVAAEDFHGDGSDGEVHAVSPNGLLSRVGDVSFSQPRRELRFVVGHGPRVPLAGQRAARAALLGHRASTQRSAGRLGHLGAILGAHGGVMQPQRSGYAANWYASLLEAQTHGVAVESVLLRQGLFGGSGLVLRDDRGVGRRLPDPPRFDPAGFEFAGEGRHAYAQLGRDLRDRLAGDVELDRIVDKRLVEGTHHVYNLHTDEGWYSANGLVVSNCVCEVLPVYQGADPGIRLNGDDLGALYDAAGGNTREKLRRVTVAIAEHAELGPILVDADQNNRGPADYARQKTSRSKVKWLAQLDALEQLHEITKIRVSRGDRLERTLRDQTERIGQLRRLAGVS
jgi:hypothetical protein